MFFMYTSVLCRAFKSEQITHFSNLSNALLKGGEIAGLHRLNYYLWDTDLAGKYFETRNGMLGSDYSTKLSPWLAHGCLSPRRVYQAIKSYEAERLKNKSTYWIIFELIWRDFYRCCIFVGPFLLTHHLVNHRCFNFFGPSSDC